MTVSSRSITRFITIMGHTLTMTSMIESKPMMDATTSFAEMGGGAGAAGLTWKKLSIDDLRKMSRDALQETCQRACQNAYLGDHVSLCRVLTRYLMHVDTRDIGVTPHLLLNGFWESWITQAIARHLQPGMCAVDVGANVGYFSVLMADLVGETGKLFALEPNPAGCSFTRKNLNLNGGGDRCTVLQAAADATDQAKVTLQMPKDDPGLASIVPGLFADRNSAELTSVECPTIKLDTLLAKEPRVDFIKIDAEGAEPRIWDGLQATLLHHSGVTIALEFTPSRYPDAAGFLKRVQREGFVLRDVKGDGSVAQSTVEEILAQPWVMLWLQRG